MSAKRKCSRDREAALSLVFNKGILENELCFSIEAPIILKSLGWCGGGPYHKIIETAQSPESKFLFPFLDLGLGLWTGCLD